jgi:hypothetical protein
MDRDFLGKIFGKVTKSIGSFAALIPLVADKIKIAIAENDGEKARAHGVELIEAGEALKNLGRSVVSATEKDPDGVIRITAVEGAEVLQVLAVAADEFEDVLKGHDEDDPAQDPTG